MMLYWQLGILLLCPLITLQRSTPDSLSYVAAVVEYTPERSPRNGKTTADLNADNYLKFIEIAASYSVDIIVFPESSLSTPPSGSTHWRTASASYVPEPRKKIIPCADSESTYAYSLKSISCAAAEHGMYVVVNHREKVDCAPSADCPADGFLVYNTNVAFDREGRVVARYRKFNLFGEGGTNITAEPQVSSFTSDFGVTFGQFICFDILFARPTLTLTRERGITDILFSAHWFSELPFLNSVEAHAAWAYANDVNFLGSGYNNPWTASGGSQIYIGRKGFVKVVSENKAQNVLIVAEIPKVIRGKRLLNINDDKVHVYEFKSSEINTTAISNPKNLIYKTDDLTPYTTELINTTSGLFNRTLCDRGLCCNFNYRLKFDENIVEKSSKYYRYRLTAFNGTRTFNGVATGGVKICGIFYCLNERESSCGELFDVSEKIVAPTTFESISIFVKNSDEKNNFFMPVTLTADILPLNATKFKYESIDLDETYHLMNLKEPRNDLMTFAIFGRNFLSDGSEVTKSSASTKSFSSPLQFIVPICVLSKYFFNS